MSLVAGSRTESGLRKEQGDLLCLQAVWPSHPFPHEALVAREFDNSIWTASSDGVIVR